jgi:hypothetical protein
MLRKDKALLESLTRKYGKDSLLNEITEYKYSNGDEALLKEIVDKYGKKTILDILDVFDAIIRHV